MKLLRNLLASALLLIAAPALAQVNPGTSPLSGPKGGTGNAFMQFTGPATSLKTFTLPNASSTLAALGTIQTWTGAQSFTDGTLILLGSGSGSSTIKAPATGGGTATLFPGSDTIAGIAATQVLTNKTFVCANQTSCVVRIASDISGLGTSVATALGVNVGTAGSVVVNGGVLGTPSSGVATNLTGTASGLTAGNVTTNANLTGPITSSGNATSIASQTGTGTKFVVDTSPALTGTPTTPTAAVDTNTTQIASTAMVLGQAASASPAAVGYAAVVGTSTRYARADHVHAVSLTSVVNSLGADVNITVANTYVDGPSVAQGTSGTWFASGTVTLLDTSTSNFFCKLWDGTTVIASGATTSVSSGNYTVLSLSGTLASPAANIKISCTNANTTTSKIKFNSSGNSKDSTLTAVRIS